MDSATMQSDWLERINRQITTLRPWWHTLQEQGGEKIIEEMIAALPRNGADVLSAFIHSFSSFSSLEVVDKADYVEKFEGFFKFMLQRYNSFRKYGPLAHLMKNFSGAERKKKDHRSLCFVIHIIIEYYNEASREYLKWMLGIADGVDPSCERYLLSLY